MAAGILIAESLTVGAVLSAVPLTVHKITRIEAGDESVGQPRIWTMIEFEVPDDDAPTFTSTLSEVIDPELGWHCDFRTTSETFVVFGGRCFCYERGDAEARSRAEVYARSIGVPASQLDWPE